MKRPASETGGIRRGLVEADLPGSVAIAARIALVRFDAGLAGEDDGLEIAVGRDRALESETEGAQEPQALDRALRRRKPECDLAFGPGAKSNDEGVRGERVPSLLAVEETEAFSPFSQTLLDELLEPGLEPAPVRGGNQRDLVLAGARPRGDDRPEPDEGIGADPLLSRRRVERALDAGKPVYEAEDRFEERRPAWRLGGAREQAQGRRQEEDARRRRAHAARRAARAVELDRDSPGSARFGEAVEVGSRQRHDANVLLRVRNALVPEQAVEPLEMRDRLLARHSHRDPDHQCPLQEGSRIEPGKTLLRRDLAEDPAEARGVGAVARVEVEPRRIGETQSREHTHDLDRAAHPGPDHALPDLLRQARGRA